MARRRDAGWKGALEPLGGAKASPAPADAALEKEAEQGAVVAGGSGGGQPRRTLAEDWASLLIALKTPVAWGGATWRMFYLTCLNGFTFFTPLIIKSLLGATVSFIFRPAWAAALVHCALVTPCAAA